MNLIGIAGPARSGKNTAADILVELSNNLYTIQSFAKPIKDMLNIIGVDTSDESKDKLDTYYGCTPRYLMQTLGTEWGRKLVDPNLWLKVFAKVNQGKHIIISDVRFENEANFVRQNGILIHLTSRGGISGNHESENPLDFKNDYVIPNIGTLEDLKKQLSSIYRKHNGHLNK